MGEPRISIQMQNKNQMPRLKHVFLPETTQTKAACFFIWKKKKEPLNVKTRKGSHLSGRFKEYKI